MTTLSLLPKILYVSQDVVLDDANVYQQKLAERGVMVQLEKVDKINAKFLRQHPELALTFDEDGLSLAVSGMKMNPHWQGEIARLKRASLKTEQLARACHVNEQPTLIDATAGLGHDALLLASLGARVMVLERHPILFTLLESQYQVAQHDGFLSKCVQDMQLHFVDAQQYLTEQQQHSVDVVYLDPMFPQRHQHTQKKAQVKKQMQMLHILLHDEQFDDEQNPNQLDLGDALLPLAQRIAKRVIVKRPRHAVFLNQQVPNHQWVGETCRFDGYFQT